MFNNTTGASSATNASKTKIAVNFHEEEVIEERSHNVQLNDNSSESESGIANIVDFH